MWHPALCKGNHAARLRDELAAAVAVRVDHATAPTVDLSGGYDSTSLALLAADRLHPARSVTAVTVHPEGVSFGGDLTYARHAAEHPGIRHRLMPLGARHLPYSNLDAVPATDEPAPSTIAHAYFSAQLQWMRTQFGSDCHLTGDGGDSLLCTAPIMLADLVTARRYRRALVEAIRWARLRRLSVWPLLRATYRTTRTTQADVVRTVARQWLRPTDAHHPAAAIGWVSGTACPPWMTPAGRERAARMAMDAADRLPPVPGIDRASLVTSQVMARVGRTARADVQVAAHHGIALHNPFADSRVVDTYLSVPLDNRPGPADYKPVLRDALADLFRHRWRPGEPRGRSLRTSTKDCGPTLRRCTAWPTGGWRSSSWSTQPSCGAPSRRCLPASPLRSRLWNPPSRPRSGCAPLMRLRPWPGQRRGTGSQHEPVFPHRVAARSGL